jgi:2-polyprenyl-3-methyl-5-hydroxy-6-metoxy-1,4-benzoquinol methylase
MRRSIKQFVKIIAETLPIAEPVFEFGSVQVSGQEGFADLRPFFPNKEYVGCDIREGPGVDRILDLHHIELPSESVGTVLLLDTLEHVEFCRKALEEVHRVLKPNGLLVISSVMKFPIHDYPHDYWRFTPEGLKSLLKPFAFSFVDSVGDPEFPHTIVGLALKGSIPDNFMNEFVREFEIWKEYWSKTPQPMWKRLVKPVVPPIILSIYRKIQRGKNVSISGKDRDMTNFNPSYIGPRDDVLNLIPDNANKVLDIGCSIGALGEKIKQRNGTEVVGVELNEQMAEVAKEKLDRVIIGDVEKMNLADYLAPNCFDCIIFADVLEHLKNPWDVLERATDFLNNEGIIIASIPNVRHYTTIVNLVIGGYWPYRERGIHDRTHLRFFTLRNIKEMFQNARLKIVKVEREYRIIERPHRYNRISKYLACPPFRDLLTFQYLIVAKKSS